MQLAKRPDNFAKATVLRTATGVFLSLLITLPACAPSWASIGADQLRLAVKDKVLEEFQSHNRSGNIEIEVGHLDSRIRLNNCSHPLKISTGKNNNRARLSVKVACAAPSPWSIYVPVTLHHYRQVVTTAMPLRRGEILTDADIELRKLDVYAIKKGYFTQADQVLGLIATRTLPEGTPLSPNNVEQADVIKKGDEVLIKASAGTISVQASGTALASGAMGEQIKVENNQSKQTVKATITGKGLVEVVL